MSSSPTCLSASFLVEWGERGQSGWLTRTLARGARILAQAKNCLVPQRLLPGWGLGCCAYAAQGLSFHLMLVAMGYDIGLPVAIFVFAFASLVGALSFIPGGLGTADATVFFLLVHFGVTKPEVGEKKRAAAAKGARKPEPMTDITEEHSFIRPFGAQFCSGELGRRFRA